MRCKTLAIAILLFLLCATVVAEVPPFAWQRDTRKGWEDYLQYGLRLGSDIMLSSRDLTATDHLEGFYSGQFGFYVRGGYKFAFFETGLHYSFYKGRYQIEPTAVFPLNVETVESRYLKVPMKLVFQWRATSTFAIYPQCGVVYKPLISITKNDIGYDKSRLQPHQFLLTAGVGFQVKFFSLDFSYLKELRPYYVIPESKKASYLQVTAGVHF